MTSPMLYKTHCQYARELLVVFVNEDKKSCGQNRLVYNEPNLVHLASDVEQFGTLDAF